MSVLAVGIVVLVITFTVVLDDDFKKDDIMSSSLALLCIAAGLALFVIGCLIHCYQLLIGIMP